MARLPRPALHPCDVQPGLGQPNWTVGIKVGRDGNGGYWLLDMLRQRANPGDVEKLNIASQDGARVRIGFGQDPGQAGNSQALIWSGRSVDSA